MNPNPEVDDDFLRELAERVAERVAERLAPLLTHKNVPLVPVATEPDDALDSDLSRKVQLILGAATRDLSPGQKFYSPEQVYERTGWSKNEFVEVRSTLAKQGYVQKRKIPECSWKVWTWVGARDTAPTGDLPPLERLILAADQQLSPGDKFFDKGTIMDNLPCGDSAAERIIFEVQRIGLIKEDWTNGVLSYIWTPPEPT